MPRQQATVVENNFIGGLITETTALKFPPNACTETDNCVFDETGRVTRRLGIDHEEGAVVTSITTEDEAVLTEFAWNAVGGDGNVNFIVQQQANFIRFYDVRDNTTPSANQASLLVDLDTYTITGSSRDAAHEQCQYTVHTGNLIIANPACDPILCVYDNVSETMTVSAIELKIRDFAGVDDGLDLNKRPTETVSSLKTNNPEHYYNLLNQGWYHGSTGTVGPDTGATMDQWDTARTDLPSNADQVALFRSSETDAFDNAVLLANSPGSTPAPKGHFILSVTEQDRNTAMTDEGFTGATLGLVGSFIAAATGTAIGDADGTTETQAFDGTTNSADTGLGGGNGASWGYTPVATKTDGYVGKSFLGSPKKIHSIAVYGSNDQGYVKGGSNPSMTFDLYGKTGVAPANATDGTLLGTLTFTDTNDEHASRAVSSSDTTTFFDYVWLRIRRTDGTATTFKVVEIEMYQPVSAASPIPSTTERPHTLTTYAGRVFYAGINGLGLNSSVFFTQIVEKNDQYGQCYQKNDPTSEDFSDLLPDDGGVIKIPDIGNVVKLFGFQTSLVVLATNGVWLISGSGGQAFAANDYSVRKLSSIGTDSALSVVDYKGLPIWWGDDGINTIQFDANYDSFSVISATDQTIKSFILAIPELNRQFVKGVFDVQTEAVYWIYNDDDALTTARRYVYNRALLLNGLSKAFYPWSIVEDVTLPSIRGIVYVQEGERTLPSVVKLATTDGSDFTYSDVRDTNYVDWGTEDYESYFVSGYRIDGQGQRFFQAPYIFFYLEEEANASAFMQGIWDFYSDSSSGKWSSTQQIYQTNTSNRAVRFRRLKLRGKGRALQIKVFSETGKPFTLIGWTVLESGNTNV